MNFSILVSLCVIQYEHHIINIYIGNNKIFLIYNYIRNNKITNVQFKYLIRLDYLEIAFGQYYENHLQNIWTPNRISSKSWLQDILPHISCILQLVLLVPWLFVVLFVHRVTVLTGHINTNANDVGEVFVHSLEIDLKGDNCIMYRSLIFLNTPSLLKYTGGGYYTLICFGMW